MTTLRSFEEIEAWQLARQLTREIYQASAHGPFARDFGLKDQIRRAAVSIMSNIAEGFERGGNREFVQFLSISKASTGELRSQLYVALDVGHIDQSQFNHLVDLTLQISKRLGGLMKYLQQSSYKGSKYKPQP